MKQASFNSYTSLTVQSYRNGRYSIVPIRDKDKYDILKWRNEQMYHLRQERPITKNEQEHYFKTVVTSLFEQDKPTQILFSYLEDGKCIGYGGLVHINWADRNAEISFLINTKLEDRHFIFHWKTYLSLIEEVAFCDLKLHKIFTYAFDLRPKLYDALSQANYTQEAVLKEHSLWQNTFVDVIVHRKFNDKIFIRNATELDKDIYFEWTNDELVRKQSFNSEKISFEDHNEWFDEKLRDPKTYMYIIENHLLQHIGQVRLQFKGDDQRKATISVSVSSTFRGKGYGSLVIKKAVDKFCGQHREVEIEAYIKVDNLKSVNSFLSAGFVKKGDLEYKGFKSVLLTYKNENR